MCILASHAIADLCAHAKCCVRINVDFNIRVTGKHIDLYKLYQIITSRGGYDKVSGEKLAWRNIGGDFHLGSQNAAAYAFALKTTYYKNLA